MNNWLLPDLYLTQMQVRTKPFCKGISTGGNLHDTVNRVHTFLKSLRRVVFLGPHSAIARKQDCVCLDDVFASAYFCALGQMSSDMD